MGDIKVIPPNFDPVKFHTDQVVSCARRLTAFWRASHEDGGYSDLTEDFLMLEEALHMLEESRTKE